MLEAMQVLADTMRNMAFSGHTSGIDLAYSVMVEMRTRYMPDDEEDRLRANALLVDADLLRRYRK